MLFLNCSFIINHILEATAHYAKQLKQDCDILRAKPSSCI